MQYVSYPCDPNVAFIEPDELSYEIPGYDGARISKRAPPGKFLLRHYADARTLTEVMERGCRVSGNGRCVGWKNSKNKYSWLSYSEFMSRALSFGSGLEEIGIKMHRSNRISIYAPNSIEWLVAEFGCFYHSCAIVPLYDTIGPDSRSYMINNAETQVIICNDEKKVQVLLKESDQTPNLKYIIHMEEVSDETAMLGKEKKIELHLFSAVEELGKTSSSHIKVAKPSDTAIICYTSGSTGTPKAGIITHESLIASLSGLHDAMGDLKHSKNDVSLSYLPLAHVAEHLNQLSLFMNGGSVGFFGGDLALLTEDIKVLQPTILLAVPRILTRIHNEMMKHVKKLKASIKENHHTNGNGVNGTEMDRTSDDNLDPRICKLLINYLGGKLRMILVGAAPISDKIVNFYYKDLGCDFVDCYGMTECSGIICVNVISPETIGNIGPPVSCNMVKLVDVPDLGYFSEFKTGEICLKGPNVFKGYYNNPQKTSEALDEDGWLHTGDIAMWLANGTLRLIDRKKHIFKLSQGEYIVPEKIEQTYMNSSFISQIFVDGDSLQSFLVGIVVPDENEVRIWCQEHSITGTWEEICENKEVKQHVLQDLQNVGEIGGLYSFQQVKDIYLHPKPFSFGEGHLTPTLKYKREFIKKGFTEEIQRMYSKKDSE